jgi:hypothetical protein
MSKRLIRLGNKEISANISKLQDKDLHVIAVSGQTYFGQMISCTDDVFVLKDLRSHEHRLALSDIERVIYDQEALW